ncbi:hypothetical protein QQY66_06345 [Streptomyces sp. DG2A-72]|uniref:hypothetical protein n=1 Tax=Streptomyces sp. DG2A-72 TaxID=3051386 RepID=UPI00265C2ADA|nr:hypothetical protein [Streptomyces sp. DG2A-72]MDO0931319.1 hypothetical protein [Streptomyces sp. DG2A-72]
MAARRTTSKTVAVANAGTPAVCSYCNGATSEYGCREVVAGWYCVNGGALWRMRTRPRTPEPIIKAEQEVIDECAPRIAEAQKVEAEAEEEYEAKSKAWADAELSVRAAVNEDAEAQYAAAYSGRRPKPHPRLDRLRGELTQRREELDEAEQLLRKARVKAGQAVRHSEQARRIARDRASWPEAV